MLNRGSRGWTSLGAGLLMLAATVLATLAVAALAGVDGLRENVSEIEENPDFGSLFFSLTAWGALALVAAVAALGAGATLWRRDSPNTRLAGLLGAYFALIVAFFTLAIFRWAGVAVVVVLLLAIFVLSYLGPRRS